MSGVEMTDNNMASEGRGKGIKRKKKKSFMQNARKYGRKGTYGRGSHLDEETYKYMIRVLELVRDNDFPSIEEKLVFVNNVYEEMVEHEVDYAKNQIGSRVIDSLMKHASLEVVTRFATAFMEVLRPICSDRFASHVLQKIMIICAERGTRSLNTSTISKDDTTVDVKEEQVKIYNDWTLKLSKYIMNNMEDFVWDSCANHIIRTVIELLGGLNVDSSDNGENRSKKNEPVDLSKRKIVPQEYTDILLEICKRLSSWPQLPEFPRNELTSGLLQVLLYSVKDVDKQASKALTKKVVSDCFDSQDETQISSAFNSESSMRLLEACLAVASPKLYTQIYAKFFINRINRLALMVGANFTVQRLFNNCQVKEELETLFDEISPHFEAIIEKGNLGVIASVADTCRRLQARQGAFISAMATALHCEQPADRQNSIALLVARMKPFETLASEDKGGEYRVNLHGSLILQAMLHFNKPIKIVNSLLEGNGIDLRILFADPRGSRVMDAFAESKFIGEKSREKMARKLGGNWVQLACSKHGSRSLEKVWQWSQMKQKLWMIEELASVGASLLATEAGKIISSKLNVPLFARSRKDWSDSLGKEEKTKALFADIIGDPPPGK
ncbi:nucleolar protein 9 [Neodiprion virginianus]|uniref:nucleolar protein 9 n=1 Tax=Neodiprion virginianus TaxID=2961670 RepID=UPI001EE72499|nr:nucleolar protein 9 [Neodiprion virginianus]